MGNNSEQFRHILVVEDRKARRILTLEDSTYSIGRDTKNDIVLYDNQVSRYHATLLRIIDYKTDQFLYRIIDGDLQGKRSTNGLIINSKTSLSHELKHGDIIRFGGKAKAFYHVVSANSPDFNLLNPDEELEEKTAIRNQKEKTDIEEQSKQTLSRHEPELEKLNQEELLRLASFPELSPNPIIELDEEGKITYANSAAILRFKDLEKNGSEHPILAGLINKNSLNHKPGGLFVREVKIGTEVYEQYVHYLAEAHLVRSYVFDYTKRKQSDVTSKTNEILYHSVVTELSEGVLIVDALTQKIIQVNQAYSQLLGYSTLEILQLSLNDLVAFEEDVLEKGIQNSVNLIDKLVGKSIHRKKDGSLIDVNVTIRRTQYEDKQLLCFIVNEDKWQINKSEQSSSYSSVYDPLTGLPNRTVFYEYLTTAIANAERNRDLIAVLLIEINYRQKITTPTEQQQQETILQNIAHILRHILRAGDTVARWDDHQFAILLPRIFQIKDVAKVAQRLLKGLHHLTESDSLFQTSYLGITVYPLEGEDASTLLKNAVVALEQAKKQEKIHYSFYSAKINRKTPTLVRLEKLLKQALAAEQFQVYYQPIVKINDQSIVALEASLRWQHPDLGIIMPEKFMHLAAQTNMVQPIGEWLIKNVCAQNKAWEASGMAIIPISVNILPQQLEEANFVEKLAAIIEKNQLDHYFLEIEINADCIQKNEELAKKTIQELSKLGVGICLDDFGKGISYLEYLQKFTFRRLKIHHSLTHSLLDSNSNHAIIAAAIALGNGFKVKVTAQGVENDQQVQKLRELNCDEIQGKWFSKPLTEEEVNNLLDSQNLN